ncbi:MAG TPA: WbuC family cupin fold metalloprotein, partial [Polyangiaceae bacterium]|nr:WbuC family cupin fold metalloprotein [Polyangiaceae bacterium]
PEREIMEAFDPKRSVPDPPSVQLIDAELLEQTLARARSSVRLRTNHNFHSSADSNPHRFLNALVRGTYSVPHRHVAPPKSESFVVLLGEVAVFLFDEDGTLRERHVLGRKGLLGIDIGPGLYHSIAAVTETAVCFEVKPGPYDPAHDKDLAPWAPREGDPEAAGYLSRLLQGLA